MGSLVIPVISHFPSHNSRASPGKSPARSFCTDCPEHLGKGIWCRGFSASQGHRGSQPARARRIPAALWENDPGPPCRCQPAAEPVTGTLRSATAQRSSICAAQGSCRAERHLLPHLCRPGTSFLSQRYQRSHLRSGRSPSPRSVQRSTPCEHRALLPSAPSGRGTGGFIILFQPGLGEKKKIVKKVLGSQNWNIG